MKEGELKLLDLIDLEFLQKFQDAYANTMDLASITVDKEGPITKPSNFTDFCTKYTRGTDLGAKRCNDCDLKWGQLAAEKGEPLVYTCHSGLIDFAVPIIVGGKHLASILCGQVLTGKPNEEHFRELARELGVDEDEYVKAVKKIKIIPRKKIEEAAKLLFLIANAISRIANKRAALMEKNAKERLYRNISEKIRNSLNIDETKKIIVDIIGQTLRADRCFIVDYDNNNEKYLIINDEYLSSPDVIPYKGADINADVPEFAAMIKEGKQIIINNKNILNEDENKDFTVENAAIERHGIKSAFALPLYYGEEFLGGIAVHYIKEKHFIEGYVAEQERAFIKQRQSEGIKLAKEKGKRLGKPPIAFPSNWHEVYSIWDKKEITAREAMKRMNLKPTSFYKLVKMHNELKH